MGFFSSTQKRSLKWRRQTHHLFMWNPESLPWFRNLQTMSGMMSECGRISVWFAACDDVLHSRFEVFFSTHYLLSSSSLRSKYRFQKKLLECIYNCCWDVLLLYFLACLYFNVKSLLENIGTFVLFIQIRKCRNSEMVLFFFHFIHNNPLIVFMIF